MASKRRSFSLPDVSAPFVAIDFETADHGRDSACAVALVRVEAGQIVQREYSLIRPPRRQMVFSYVHGITWKDVASAPLFAEVWPRLSSILNGVHYLAAHNAPFDRGVLAACCDTAQLSVPALPFICTVQLARRCWGESRNDLPSVCRRLGIGLIHHQASSDAEACARIVIASASIKESQQATLSKKQ